MKPLVAVTGPHKTFRFGWWATRFMLAISGVRSVYLTARSVLPDEPVHGIIIGGGDDIEPEHYGGEVLPRRRYDIERDEFEIGMIRKALQDSIPMLGICRGAQLINVVSRGSLHQNIRPLRRITSNRRSLHPVKWVDLESTSRLAETLGSNKVKVNSLHDQAIDRLGNGLTVVGRDRDGFVQALEGSFGFLLGVQWHPEYLPYMKSQRRLFRLFTDAVRNSERELVLGQ
ncbi:gamma-glutamyl-gamma-aminobutyrate hydrolase family protein [Ketobacter sp. MCCC 1A13808]|nr:gamma-glutamyl-gamma-aminobutyrate hydrolase family protein [Ketobacter sp. MCCC 1A13808]RLP54361.1 MAG: gamma-glutamyl-gamma-aminobutyrate hydrolase family protein [Ketobacter sp.]